MHSPSKIFGKGVVYLPDWVLQSLSLAEGSEIVWKYDSGSSRVYVEKMKTQSLKQFEEAEPQSRYKPQLLFALESGPKIFKELCDILDVTPKTLAKLLNVCENQRLVEHKGKNKPYSLTQLGFELLKTIGDPKPLEGNDIAIEIVKAGPFIGSILLRLPSRIGRQFAEQLYTPKSIEDLNRILILGLDFWASKHSQVSPFVEFTYLGRDFNADGIEDLIIAETPRGYPNIRKALKENQMPMPLWDYCLNAAEEKLSRLA